MTNLNNVKIVAVHSGVFHADGKTNAKWQLVNQREIDWLYHQRKAFNI